MKRLDSILLVAEGTKKLIEYIGLKEVENAWDGTVTTAELREVGIDERLFGALKRRDVISHSRPVRRTYYGFGVEFNSKENFEKFAYLWGTEPREVLDLLEPYEVTRNEYRYRIDEDKLAWLIEKSDREVSDAIEKLFLYQF